ncbi:MAG: xanthine dehydrogenase family protein molybdopterin-binding subunit, partial [Mesorhizobium sp.]
MTAALIGKSVSRVDGRLKVTGAATYAAEFEVPNLAHAAVVRSIVANGRIASVDTAEAERAPGVIAVVTHRSAPCLAYQPHKGLPDAAVGERLHVLQDDRVTHQGQPIALVVAETLEQAVYAAEVVRVTYRHEAAATDMESVDPVLPTGKPAEWEIRRGEPDSAFEQAEFRVDQTYVIPRENHNPIEMFATIASWQGGSLTLWDKTQ